MPRKDKTGSQGQKPGTGIGRGGATGRRQGSGFGAGLEGNCVCPVCGLKAAHQLGAPCHEMNCPKCGGVMAVSE